MIPYLQEVFQDLHNEFPKEQNYLNAVKSYLNKLDPDREQVEAWKKNAELESFIRPERVISFKIPWTDDHGITHINNGWRVQFNSEKGVYKGGLRFDTDVDLDILKALAFEQVQKNGMTGLPLGGAKGGADFNKKDKSKAEIKRFCESFIEQLGPFIGSDIDVPAGDLGVGSYEIQCMYQAYQEIFEKDPAVFTGKPLDLGGSLGRTEATGYGLLYYIQGMLENTDKTLENAKIIISGAGNVATHAAEKAVELGAKVIAMSDRSATIVKEDGLDVMAIKKHAFEEDQKLSDYQEDGAEFYDQSVWELDLEADIALPCATQNEIDLDKAKRIVNNKIWLVAEGANLPSTEEAIQCFYDNDILYGPAKEANAGGVTVSYFEMVQNKNQVKWSFEKVDQELKKVMQSYHQ